MLSQQQRNFLGLNLKEAALLKALSKGSLNTSEAAKQAALPRVTALRLLTQLWQRGFVARHKASREVRWSTVNEKLLRKRLELSTEDERTSGKTIPLSDIASVLLYKGREEMLASNRKLLASHPGERVYFIEPNAIWKHTTKIPASEWVHLNRLLKQKQIIGEVIVEEGYEKVLEQYVGKEWQESFFALAHDLRVMPAGLMPTTVETMIFRDQVLFSDWEQLTGVEVASSSVVKALKGLFTTLQKVSRPIQR